MKVVALLASAFLVNFAQAQTPARNSPPPVEKFCGKLVHVEHVPDKDIPNAFEARTENLPHVPVRLYRADGNRRCCEGLPLIGEAITGRRGYFQLKEKGLEDGLYWIVARHNLREHQLLVQFEPKKNPAELCSAVSYELDDFGNMSQTVTIVIE